MTKPNARGGARTGAGRKALPGGKHKVRRALLTDDHVEKAEQIGSGNMSAGIREAISGHSTKTALIVASDWEALLYQYEEFGIEGREMRCQKVDGIWYGQVYEVQP